MKKIFSLMTLWMLCMCAMAADTENTMAEAYHIYPYAEAPGQAGTSAEILLIMKNRNPIATWQCTLELPQGITFNSVALAEVDGRYPEGYNAQLTQTVNADGNVITFTCHGTEGVALTGVDGAVAVVTVDIARTVAPGDYEVFVKNILLVEPNEHIHDYGIDRKMVWTIEPAEIVEGTITFDTNGGEPAEIAPITQEVGTAVEAPADPTREGYTFAGWEPAVPETMPEGQTDCVAQWTINSYNLIYVVDGEEYQRFTYEYGAEVTPLADLTREGYTFSGWSEIPATMPASDVTVTGSFTVNSYDVIYVVDGEEYERNTYEYGAEVTPLTEPTKEGYTFSGWSEIPATMPAGDVTVTGSFTVNSHELIYIVDGEEYGRYVYEYGAEITPIEEPTKEGYVFSGWSNIPATMPDEDVTVTGTFEAVVEFITLSQQYTPFSCARDLDFTDSDLKAYIVTGYIQPLKYAVLEEVQVVPAGTGVMLIGEVGTTYMVPFSDAETQAPEGNLLVGVVEETTVSVQDEALTDYVFESEENGFKPQTADFEMPAQSAYLQLPTEQVVAGAIVHFGILDTSDGITGLKQNVDENAIFDLQGRRVSKAGKGIYIIGGKKVLH